MDGTAECGTQSRPGVWRALAATALGASLAGCAMVGPNFTAPKTPEVKAWMAANTPSPDSATGLTTRSAPVTDWWRTFNDKTLDALIAEAYAQNLTLQMAGSRVLQARAQLGIAAGELFPQSQSVGASASRTKVSENLQFVSDIERFVDLDTTFDTRQIGFDATWEIDVWGGIRRNVQSAEANLVAQVANYDDALVTLTGDVAAVYINIRAIQEALVITRQNVKLQEDALKLTELRFQNGVTTDLDVQQATALLNDTRATIPALESDEQQAKNALAVLLAVPPEQMNVRLGNTARIPVSRVKVGVGIPAELLRRRPDVRAAEMEAAAQSAQIGVAIAQLYPQFGLAGDIGWQASGGRSLFSAQSVAGSLTPGVRWNVLNYGRLKNNVRAQDAAFQGLVANYQNTVLAAYAEVENAMVAYAGARRQVAYLSDSVTAAKKAADIAMSQYSDGIADYQRVLDAQRMALGAEAKLVQARSAVSENLVALYKALGGGWQIRAGREFLPDETLAEMAYRTDWGDLLQKNPRGTSTQ
ncbi:MAG: efflux transporter outer membrane subunit [Rhodobacteraceae bacterium]|nr:efflux transporter outer membrane subunit [Paracoccaceae bacterium]